MAAPTNVRVRLTFDYPPPAIPESCMFLLLVDVKRCRVVTDLGSIIRERFFYGQRGGLSLYVDDCLLPPGESIQVIRDNDSIRVKWDEVYPEDEFETRNHILSPPKKSKKRHRKKSSEETEDSEIKPKKQKTDYSEEYLNSSSDHIVNKRRKNKKKRKKERCLLDNCVETNEIHRKSIKGMLDEEDETKKSKKLTISEEQPAGKCSRKSLTLGASKNDSNLKAKKTRKESSSSDSSEEATAVHTNQLKASPALTKIQTNLIRLSNISVKKTLNSASPVNRKKKESSSSSLDSSEEDNVKVKKKNVAVDGLCSPNVVKKVQDEDVNKEHEVGIHKEQNSFKQSKKTLPISASKLNSDFSAKVTKKHVSTSSEDSDSTSESDHESTTVHKKLSNVSSAAAKKPDKGSSSLAVKNSLLPTTNHAAKADKRKNKESSSSSSCSDSSEENSENVNTSKSRFIGDSLNSVVSQKKKQSDSSDSDTLVIKKSSASSFVSGLVPANGKPSASDDVQGPSLDPIVWGRGVGRGRGRGDNSPWRGRGFRGRGDGKNPGRGRGENPQLSYNTEIQKEQQLNESATNKSVIIENPPVIPKKDYSTLPLLAAPPQVGKLIAFKLLELTENYTPEVSDYKEGKILCFDPFTKQLDVEIYSNESVLKEPGKFDLVYQMAGGRNIVEYAVQQDRRITQRWDSLIEPRLILDSVPQEALSTPQTVNTGL